MHTGACRHAGASPRPRGPLRLAAWLPGQCTLSPPCSSSQAISASVPHSSLGNTVNRERRTALWHPARRTETAAPPPKEPTLTREAGKHGRGTCHWLLTLDLAPLGNELCSLNSREADGRQGAECSRTWLLPPTTCSRASGRGRYLLIFPKSYSEPAESDSPGWGPGTCTSNQLLRWL